MLVSKNSEKKLQSFYIIDLIASVIINFKNPYAKIEKGKTKKQMGKNDNAED